MELDVYEKLRERLDIFPTSFPKTEEGIEIAILKRLFSEKEAEIAGLLPLMGKESPASMETISLQMKGNSKALSRILENMAPKGLVHVKGFKEFRQYSLLPFMPGIYEFNFDRVDRELAELLDRYMTRYPYRQTFKSKSPVGRIIPVNRSISSLTTVHPYEDIVKAIETSSSLAVTPCICRTKKKALDKGCDYPLETCLYLNDYADYLNRIGKGRNLSQGEALALLQKTAGAGLVHLSMNLQETAVICSCCPCCCEGLKGIIKLAKMEKLELGSVMNFDLVIDHDRCTLCETCLGRCPTEALTVKDNHLVLNPARCFGCGACVHTCPAEALWLERKPEAEIKPTPRDFSELFSQMGWRSGRSEMEEGRRRSGDPKG